MRASHTHGRRATSAGFTLLEMIIAVTIMAVLAAAAIPVTSTVVAYHMRKATRAELSVLSEACGEYFRDTGRLPATIADLIDPLPGNAPPARAAGWAGPYLPGETVDPISQLSGYEVDAWSRAYVLRANGDLLALQSAGDDAVPGNEDDLTIELNVTWIRREETLERLRVVNQAIVLYNGQYQLTNPLPADYTAINQKLVSKGFLPSSTDYLTDAWGDAFVEDPRGSVPVVRVQSTHVGDTAALGSLSKSKKGKKKP